MIKWPMGPSINDVTDWGQGFCDDSLSTKERDDGGRGVRVQNCPKLLNVICGRPLNRTKMVYLKSFYQSIHNRVLKEL